MNGFCCFLLVNVACFLKFWAKVFWGFGFFGLFLLFIVSIFCLFFGLLKSKKHTRTFQLPLLSLLGFEY